MALSLDADTVRRINSVAEVLARRERPNRARVSVDQLLLKDTGVTVGFSCGGAHRDQPGFIELSWQELETLVGS